MAVKACVIYGSTTGNTGELARLVAEGLRSAGVEVVVKNVTRAYPQELLAYDGIALGSSTWGDGELQKDFKYFYEDLLQVDLTGKKAVVFGSCDPLYEKFGQGVEILAETLPRLGACLVAEGLKVVRSPKADDREKCLSLGRRLAAAILTP